MNALQSKHADALQWKLIETWYWIQFLVLTTIGASYGLPYCEGQGIANKKQRKSIICIY